MKNKEHHKSGLDNSKRKEELDRRRIIWSRRVRAGEICGIYPGYF